jgi:hypothetical protein
MMTGMNLVCGLGAHAADHLVAVHARHHHVGDDEVGLVQLDRRKPLHAVVGREDLIALVLQREGEEESLVRLVVNDEDAQFACHKFAKNSACTPPGFVLLCPLIQGMVYPV